MSIQPSVNSLSENVTLKLSELEALGVQVPTGAYRDAMDLSKMQKYVDSAARTNDICDILIEIHS